MHLLNKEAPQPSFLGTAVGLKVCWKNDGIPLNHASFRDRKFGFSVVLICPHPHGPADQYHTGSFSVVRTQYSTPFRENVNALYQVKGRKSIDKPMNL